MGAMQVVCRQRVSPAVQCEFSDNYKKERKKKKLSRSYIT